MDVRKKKQKKLEPFSEEEFTAGDFWCFTAIKRKSFFFTAFAVGKRTINTCRMLMNRFEDCVQKPTPENKLEALSDGNFEYESTFPEYYSVDCINYGQIIKVKRGSRVVEKIKKVIFGDPRWIETVNVECHNGIIRGRLSRLIRKTKCHSKCRFQLENHIALFQFYWNFIKPLHGKLSPGMEEGLTNKLWTWGNFLHWQLRVRN